LNRLSGKTVAVAGATGGIGEGVTKYLLQQGAKVVALGRNEAKLDQLKSYLSEVGEGELVTIPIDLGQDYAGNREVGNRLREQFGHFDGAVVSIGNWGNANMRLLEVSDELWEKAIQDNLTSHFRTLRLLVPLLKERAALIHFSGLSADMPYPGAGVIGLTNAAKKSLVLTMSIEQEHIGPRIYELIIGPIRTRERVAQGMAQAHWYDPGELGEFVFELIRGGTEASLKSLHYLVRG
jgi:NAD(P)-dependent dehydrogenase (short-subunit alcohol dehydrogenase family)